jgi:hypothetical protein
MAKSTRRKTIDDGKAAVESALDLLREDPARLKRLLRETASLADEFASVLEDAEQDATAKKLSRVATTLRGGALLPAALSIALLRKALEKLVAAAG